MFRCRKCHEYEHLFQECPQNHKPAVNPKPMGEKDVDGFEQVGNRRRMTKHNPNLEGRTQTQTGNWFVALSKTIGEEEGSGDREKTDGKTPPKKQLEGEQQKRIAVELEETKIAGEDMDLGELDLDGIEKAYDDPKIGYIPFTQIALLKEEIIKSKGG